MKKSVLIVLGLATVLVSCGGAEETKEPAKEIKVIEESTAEAIYSYDHSTTEVKWTGYKLPGEKKAGVGGWFESVEVNGFKEGTDPIAAMQGVTFNIDVASTATGDSARDAKIVNFFFGTMLNTSNISGSIKSLNGSSTAGDGVLEITMNEVSMEYPVKYTIENDVEVMIAGKIDIDTFNARAALDKLTEVCYEKHEGFTWPDVDIKVFTTLKKN